MIFTAKWVLPISAPPIRDGYVAVENGRIVGVGKRGDEHADPTPVGMAPTPTTLAPAPVSTEQKATDQTVVDFGDAILMPGFVNPHTHLELTCYAGKLPPAEFWEWIGKLIPLRREPGQLARETQGVVDGARMSLAAGVTTVGDISRRNVHWRVLKNSPLRKVCFVELLSIADHPPRNPDELRAAAMEVMGQEDELLTVGISPHAPYTVPPGEIAAALELADELDRPWCTHWCETEGEIAFLRGEMSDLPPLLAAAIQHYNIPSPRLAPMELLDLAAAHARPGTLAHVNYADDAALAYLAMAGHTVLYCPRAHRFFGHRPHPFAKMMRAGISVAIGTDSAASNDGLSILDELRFVHRNVAEPPSPDELLKMGTIAGAQALGLEREVGTLEVGKWADFAVFDAPAGTDDPARFLIEGDAKARRIWIGGVKVEF